MYLKEFLEPTLWVLSMALFGWIIWMSMGFVFKKTTMPKPNPNRKPQAWLQEDKTRTNIKPDTKLDMQMRIRERRTGRIITGDFEAIEKRLDEGMNENPELIAEMFSLYFSDIDKYLEGIGITKQSRHQIARHFWYLKDYLIMLRNHPQIDRSQTANYGYWLALRSFLPIQEMNYNPETKYHMIWRESIGNEKVTSKVYKENYHAVNVAFTDYQNLINTLNQDKNPRIGDITDEQLDQLRKEQENDL